LFEELGHSAHLITHLTPPLEIRLTKWSRKPIVKEIRNLTGWNFFSDLFLENK